MPKLDPQQISSLGFSEADTQALIASGTDFGDPTVDNNAFKQALTTTAEGLKLNLPSPLIGFGATPSGGLPGDVAPPSTVTSSEEAAKDLDGIDTMINDIGLEFPNKDESSDLFAQTQDQLNKEFKQSTDEIKAGSIKRQQEQRQANKEIMGESKAALASLGLLSDDPSMASATNAVQYVADVKTQAKKEIDQILAEEQAALTAARNAKSAGDLNLAKMQLDDARSLRQERNNLKLQALAETRAMREAERADDRLAIDKLIEDRAAKNFKREEAQNALDALIAVNFEGFDQMNPTEVKILEQKLGFIDGTLDAWHTQSTKLTALEGWSTSMQTNKNTGEVTAIYTRMNPDTGQPEFMKQSLGTIGERYAGTGTSKGFKLSADDKGKMLGAGISEADITALDSRIRESGLVPEVLDFLTDEQQEVVKTIYSGAKETVADANTIFNKIKQGGFTKVITTSETVNGKIKDIKTEVLDVDSIPDEQFNEVMQLLQDDGFFDTDDPETQETLNWWQRQTQDALNAINPFD